MSLSHSGEEEEGLEIVLSCAEFPKYSQEQHQCSLVQHRIWKGVLGLRLYLRCLLRTSALQSNQQQEEATSPFSDMDWIFIPKVL